MAHVHYLLRVLIYSQIVELRLKLNNQNTRKERKSALGDGQIPLYGSPEEGGVTPSSPGAEGVFSYHLQSSLHKESSSHYICDQTKNIQQFFIAHGMNPEPYCWLQRSDATWLQSMSTASWVPARVVFLSLEHTNFLRSFSVCVHPLRAQPRVVDDFLFSNFKLPCHFFHEAILDHSLYLN